jgi:hypothetical protein
MEITKKQRDELLNAANLEGDDMALKVLNV